MKSIFKQLEPSAPNHRNAFDLSQRHLFTAKVGQYLPMACFETLPGDFFDFDFLNLVRTMPINTAAFSRLKCSFDVVFVPYQQLWHGWNQFFLQNDENMSTGDSFNHAVLPKFDLIQVLHLCVLRSFVFYYCVRATEKGFIELYPGADVSRFKTDVYEAWHGTRGGDYEFEDSFGFSTAISVVRNLDMLGYGAYYNIIDWMNNKCKTIYSFDNTETFMDNLVNNYETIYHEIEDINWPSVIDNDSPIELLAWTYEHPDNTYTLRNLFCNPFRILAYNKIYQDYVLNKRVQKYDANLFNVDADADVSPSKIFTSLVIKYDSWDYDFFTGSFTSPQEGDVSLISGNTTIILNNPSPNNDVGAYFKKNSGVLGNPNIPNDSTRIVGPSVYDIKRAEFLQRWKENHLRAGNKSQKQALSQWNTHFRYLSDEYSDFINSFDMVINIDEVINTADNQGDISGKGIGTSNGKCSFKASDAGVIMICLHVKPRAEYDATMMDKQNTCLQPFDFPSPFFDNLGLEAVPSYLLNLQHFRGVDFDSVNDNIGYNVRYLPWKSAVDKIHGIMMSSYYTRHNGAGSMSIWATPRRELANADYLTDIDTLFYVSPKVVDTIFAAASDSYLDTDHLIFNCNVLARVVRNLSVSGMPNWNV